MGFYDVPRLLKMSNSPVLLCIPSWLPCRMERGSWLGVGSGLFGQNELTGFGDT